MKLTEARLVLTNYREALANSAEQAVAAWTRFLQNAEQAPDRITAQSCVQFAEASKQRAKRYERRLEAIDTVLTHAPIVNQEEETA